MDSFSHGTFNMYEALTDENQQHKKEKIKCLPVAQSPRPELEGRMVGPL